jgi:hypothetical protein
MLLVVTKGEAPICHTQNKKKTSNLFRFLEMNFCFLFLFKTLFQKKKEMKEKLNKKKTTSNFFRFLIII